MILQPTAYDGTNVKVITIPPNFCFEDHGSPYFTADNLSGVVTGKKAGSGSVTVN